MSAKLSQVKAFVVDDQICIVPKSWGTGSVAEWLTKKEKREIDVDDVRILSLTSKADDDLPICHHIEQKNFDKDDLPFVLN